MPNYSKELITELKEFVTEYRDDYTNLEGTLARAERNLDILRMFKVRLDTDWMRKNRPFQTDSESALNPSPLSKILGQEQGTLMLEEMRKKFQLMRAEVGDLKRRIQELENAAEWENAHIVEQCN